MTRIDWGMVAIWETLSLSATYALAMLLGTDWRHRLRLMGYATWFTATVFLACFVFAWLVGWIDV